MGEDDEYELASESQHDDTDDQNTTKVGLSRPQAWNLYVSHAFSTWNARGYEFAAILFTAAAYPDTLVEAAARMIIIYFAMILFSSSIGRWVDHSPNRLRTLLSTIVCNRGSVIVGSLFWLLILSQEDLVGADGVFSLPKNSIIKGVGFALAVTCGIIERLSASGNLMSIERDWVVTVAAPSGRHYDLTHLNAVMRRIDLVCKLFAPIVISIVVSALDSVRIGVLFTGLTSLISLPIETISARRVWKSSEVLQVPKPIPPSQHTTPQQQLSGSLMTRARQYFNDFEMYFSTTVWVPSVALALLHFNMLTWRATFITSLINVGYSLNVITVARAIGSVFEICSTIVTPYGIVYLGKTQSQRRSSVVEEDEAGVGLIEENEDADLDVQTIVGLTRFGLWGFTWQVVNTIPVVLAIWAIYPHEEDPEPGLPPGAPAAPPRPAQQQQQPPWGWSLALFAFLALSRFGVWVYDLTTQQLAQTLVPARRRATFAGVEGTVVNAFELAGAAAAAALPRTAQFGLLAGLSALAVAAAWAMYAAWVRRRRGHLVHWEKVPGLRRLGSGGKKP